MEKQTEGEGAGPASVQEQARLVIVKREPFNAEATVDALRQARTPTANFYVRSNFSMPHVETETWHLRLAGAVREPLDLSLAELKSLPARSFSVTLECAGNGRLGFLPLPQGEPWGFGAVGTAIWTGVPLAHLFERAGLSRSVVEVLFTGADTGVPSGGEQTISFARSLPLAKALHGDTLLAYEMNGEPLPHEHGGPVRLLVPGWYGMASVKWLDEITALEEPYTGFYQRDRYVLDYPDDPGPQPEPVQSMQVRASITSLQPGETLQPGPRLVTGFAWSGAGGVASVEVSVEGGAPWQPARLVDPAVPYTWQRWEFDWDATKLGRHAVRARATDVYGNVQPDIARWNRLGYCNNAVQPVVVEVKQ